MRCGALLLATALMVIAVSMSKLGFGLACIRQNETAANMIGLNATLYKSIAFGLSACFVGAAGGLYAAWVHYIDPSDVFDILYSVKPIVMALMGGLGSPLGVVSGAFRLSRARRRWSGATTSRSTAACSAC